MSSWSEQSSPPLATGLIATRPVNLALYSDQIIADDARTDRALIDMLTRLGRGKRFGYVPSGPDPDLHYFRDSQAYYARYAIDLAVFCDLDEPGLADQLSALLDCDAIHLSGGHTGGFLHRLRISGALQRLRDWVLNGGVLVGASAGAILMSPTIAVDGLFIDCRPEEVRDGAALDLVPFEFFPHLNDSAAFLPELIRYSLSTPRPIVACRDGDGVVVERGIPTFIGDPLLIRNGSVTRLNEAGDGRSGAVTAT